MSDRLEILTRAEEAIRRSDELSKKVDRMLFYLEDDAKTGKKGFISTQLDHEYRISELESDKNYGRGRQTAFASIYIAVGTVITWSITHLDDLIHFFTRIFTND